MLKKSMLLLTSATVALLASDTATVSEGKALMQKHCAACHMLATPTPDMIPTFKAPAMDAVGFHLKLAMQDKAQMKRFVVDYVQHPDAAKSVCESNKVQKFGVMPSLKGKVSPADLEKIADYLVEHYPSPEFTAMIKEIQKNDKLNALKHAPFLINRDGLPHLTKLLMQNWDKAKLGLTPEQKTKLLAIRKDTLGSVGRIKKVLEPLETEVIEAMIDREDPKSVEKQIARIAALKAEATRAHLKCISETLKVLNDEQVAYLLPFGDY